MNCTCPHLMLGLEPTETKNWHPDCEEHGLDSDWYNSTQQNQKRERQRIRTRKLQHLSSERRKGNISKEEARRIIQELDNKENT